MAIAAAVEDPPLGPDFEHLRWFALPSEVVSELQGKGPCAQDTGRRSFRTRP
jgi:hypothetical protein